MTPKVNAGLTIVGGAGHVGVPLALAFTKAGFRVNINDRDQEALNKLTLGIMPFMEEGAQELLKKALDRDLLVFTSKPEEISTTGPVIITIGTPVDGRGQPLKEVVLDCVKSLEPHLQDEQLLILRSTVYPGTTKEVDAWLRAQNRKIPLAFCPERILQGRALEELGKIPQIVAGTTGTAQQRAAELFLKITPYSVTLTPLEAELAKLFSNAHRYVEFALANQLCLIARSAGVDYHRLLRSMMYRYPRAATMRRPGFSGGPCLPKDTMQLLHYARTQILEAPLLDEALDMNDHDVVFNVLDQIFEMFPTDTHGSLKVGLLGAAFKPESDDTRGSLTYELKFILEEAVGVLYITDPYVTTDPDLVSLETVLEECDVLVLCTPHLQYREYLLEDCKLLKGKPIISVWGL